MGNQKEAAAEFREAFRLDPSWPERANLAARRLATHPDARVRRAAAMAARANENARTTALLLGRFAIESDEVTRTVLASGLAGGDPDGIVPTSVLIERIASGAPDAPLCAIALARRTDEKLAPKVDALLDSSDPVMRAHAARGLAMSAAPDVAGRLSHAYEFETDAGVRRAVIDGLASRTSGAASPSGRETLELAASLDPDGPIRWRAERALGAGRAASPALVPEAAWVRLVPAEGTSVPPDSVGLLVGSDGLGVPVAFDDDGYAVVPGIPPGEARLRLAPALPPYSASSR